MVEETIEKIVMKKRFICGDIGGKFDEEKNACVVSFDTAIRLSDNNIWKIPTEFGIKILKTRLEHENMRTEKLLEDLSPHEIGPDAFMVTENEKFIKQIDRWLKKLEETYILVESGELY